MAGKSSEDYWNASSNASFNFDDDGELERQFLSAEGFNSTQSTDIFGSNLGENGSQTKTVLSLESLVTKRNLHAVLDGVSMPRQVSTPPVQETILKMFLGMPYVLYPYRSLSQKFELLNEAIATDDGDIILAVLLYLKKTLSSSVFIDNLVKRKTALQQYSNYLIKEVKLEELSNLYIATGNLSDLVYLFYLKLNNNISKENLHNRLLQFSADYQSKLDHDKKVMFSDYSNFIKWQLNTKIFGDSITEHLVALYKAEAEQKSDNAKLRATFKNSFKIHDLQYEWVQLNTFCGTAKWNKLKEIFIKPNWLTKKSVLKSVIDSELFISTLHRHNVPKPILEEFLMCLVDSGISLTLAKKMKCHKFIINLYTSQRDRQAILKYKEDIPNQSEEYFYIENILRSADKRWKN